MNYHDANDSSAKKLSCFKELQKKKKNICYHQNLKKKDIDFFN